MGERAHPEGPGVGLGWGQSEAASVTCPLSSCSPQSGQVHGSSSDAVYPRVAGMPLAQPLVEHYMPRSLDPNMPVIVNTCSLREEGEGTEDRHSAADGEMFRYSEEEDSEGEEKSDGELVVLTD